MKEEETFTLPSVFNPLLFFLVTLALGLAVTFALHACTAAKEEPAPPLAQAQEETRAATEGPQTRMSAPRVKPLGKPGAFLADSPPPADVQTFTPTQPAGPHTRPLPHPAKRPAPVLRPDPVLFDFERWAEEALVRASARFEVPTPDHAFIKGAPPRGARLCLNCVTYNSKEKEIALWFTYPDGKPVPVAERQRALLHAFLHYVEDSRGLDITGGDHAAAFDRQLQAAGLLRPSR